MSDTPTTPVPTEPAPGKSSGKKTTTQVISIQPTESRSGGVPTPKTIQLQRPTAATINLDGAPSPSAPSGKGDTARLSEMPTAARQAAPRNVTPPLEGIRQRLPAERKGETIRISLTDVLPQPRKPVDGKRAILPVPEPTTVAAPMPATIQPKRPPISPIAVVPQPGIPLPTVKAKTSPLEVPTAARPAAEGLPVSRFPEIGTPVETDDKKKRTTRLILDATAAAMSAAEFKHSTSPITVIPQTIRLKRPGSAAVAAPPQAKSRTDVIGEAPTGMHTPDTSQVKMTTSRILVEETAPTPASPAEGKRMTFPVTAIPGTLGAAPKPRTIRLKRPSSAGLEEAVAEGLAAESPTVQKTKKAETVKIELPKEAERVPITQRKTIKIKRTERSAGPRTVTLKYPGAIVAAAPPESVTPEAIGEPEALPEEETPSPLFFAFTAAAVVLIACLIYVMAAQAFGPELVLPVPSSLL